MKTPDFRPAPSPSRAPLLHPRPLLSLLALAASLQPALAGSELVPGPVVELNPAPEAPAAVPAPLLAAQALDSAALAPGVEMQLLRLECRAAEEYAKLNHRDDVYHFSAYLAIVNRRAEPIALDGEYTILGYGPADMVVRLVSNGEELHVEPTPVGGNCSPVEEQIAPGAMSRNPWWVLTPGLCLADLSAPCDIELRGEVHLNDKPCRYSFRQRVVPRDILVLPKPPLLSTQEKALHEAASQGDADRIRQLLAAGTPMKADEHGDTPLHEAVRSGNAEAVRLLLGAGAEVNAGGFVGTPLHWALRNTREVENSPEPQDAADLLWALREGSNRFVQLPTPTAADRLRVVQVLLSAGANPNALSDEGETPLDMAKAAQAAGQAGMEDVIHLLSRVTGTPAAPEQQGGQPSEQQGQETSQSPSQSPSQQPSPGPAATVRVGMPLSEALALLRSRPDLASLEPFDGDVVTDEGEVLYLATFKTGDDALLITARRSGEAGAPGVTALTLWRNGTREVHQAKRYRNGALEPLDAFPR